MTNLEKVASALGIAGVVFTAGVAWNSLNSRLDRLTERMNLVESDKAEGLCLAIMNRQLVAIEKGRNSVREQLQVLSDKHCPNVNAYQNAAAATRPMTPEELRAAEREEQLKLQQGIEELSRINDQLTVQMDCSETGAIRRGEPGYSPRKDVDGDGTACE